jgi:hypothetical protein
VLRKLREQVSKPAWFQKPQLAHFQSPSKGRKVGLVVFASGCRSDACFRFRFLDAGPLVLVDVGGLVPE